MDTKQFLSMYFLWRGQAW